MQYIDVYYLDKRGKTVSRTTAVDSVERARGKAKTAIEKGLIFSAKREEHRIPPHRILEVIIREYGGA